MSLYADLALIEGVIAAGEYSYRGDRYNCKGQLSDEMARMASIMCRATTMATHMQVDILAATSDCKLLHPAHGWVVRGPQFTVCVIANVFCFLANQEGLLNKVIKRMQAKLTDAEELI